MNDVERRTTPPRSRAERDGAPLAARGQERGGGVDGSERGSSERRLLQPPPPPSLSAASPPSSFPSPFPLALAPLLEENTTLRSTISPASDSDASAALAAASTSAASAAARAAGSPDRAAPPAATHALAAAGDRASLIRASQRSMRAAASNWSGPSDGPGGGRSSGGARGPPARAPGDGRCVEERRERRRDFQGLAGVQAQRRPEQEDVGRDGEGPAKALGERGVGLVEAASFFFLRGGTS